MGSQMTVRSSALRASRPLPPERFLVLISVRDWVDTRAIVWLEGLGKLKKKKIHLIRTRSHDLLAYSIVPQPTTLSCAPYRSWQILYIRCSIYIWEICGHCGWRQYCGSSYTVVLFCNWGHKVLRDGSWCKLHWWSLTAKQVPLL
jgi:hypothetical protein